MQDKKRIVRSNYRCSPELDRRIQEEADRRAISKNALVQMILYEALIEKNVDQSPTGTDG